MCSFFDNKNLEFEINKCIYYIFNYYYPLMFKYRIKKLLGIIIILTTSITVNFSFAQENNSSNRINQDVDWMIESVWSMKSDVQNTKYNEISWWWIKWTLESVSELTTPYINWMIYIWLAMAIILIIFNWLLIVLAPANDSYVSKVKSRMIYIIMWIVVLTWSAVIIRIVLAIIQNLF